ncbi:MAG: PaaI family thioesterase [Actinomycetia bacterium]|nr:PaaI family thioesterase [Actinomycetes bacterium]
MNPSSHLVAKLRALLEAVRTSDLDQAQANGVDLDGIAADLHSHTDALTPFSVDGMRAQFGLREEDVRTDPDRIKRYADGEIVDLWPYSPITGDLNPVAPPIRMWRDGTGVRGAGRIPTSLNGPPNGVHGGFVAAALDELLGLAGVVAGAGGFTGTLTVRYLKLTPIDTDLDFEAHVQSVDGRKVTTTGSVSANGELCATAEAIFIRPA